MEFRSEKLGVVTYGVETKNIVKVNGGAEADGKSLDPESFVSMNF